MKAATIAYVIGDFANDISIHAAREGGDFDKFLLPYNALISIHAAREGGDSDSCNSSIITGISIHAAREGGDCGNE